MSKALEGIRVLELTHVISGPFCGMLLGDLGAEVIKAERPNTGEFYREEAQKNEEGISIIYPTYNRNKKGITLNVKAEETREIMHKLIKETDIFVENYRPGLLKKLGLGYDELKQINPRLIMVSISGFGQTGPYAKAPAYDMTIAAISGLMSVNGEHGRPTKTGPAISDFLSGIYGAVGALAALQHRERTGEGQYVDVSMMESAMSIFDAFFAQTHFTGVAPEGMGNRRANYAPVNSFKVKDGYVYIAGSKQKHWESLAKVMDRLDLLENPKFSTTTARKSNEDEIEGIVEAWTKNYEAADLVALLEAEAIPCAPVKGLKDVMHDPHVLSRESLITTTYPGLGEYPSPALTPKFSTIEVPKEAAPTLGQHNREVYCDILGYSEEEFLRMASDGVI